MPPKPETEETMMTTHPTTPLSADRPPGVEEPQPCDGCGHPEHVARECPVTRYGERCACDEPVTEGRAPDPRLALLRALNTPPYDTAAGLRGSSLCEAAQLIDDHHAAVLREVADRYQGFIDAADTGADPRYWCGINDMVLGLRHMAAEKVEATDGDR